MHQLLYFVTILLYHNIFQVMKILQNMICFNIVFLSLHL